MKSAVPYVLLGTAALAAVVYYAHQDAPRSRPHPLPRQNNPLAPSAFGLVLDEGSTIQVQDYAKWFTSAPEAFEAAIASGASTPEEVLLHVLRRALPRLKWPPQEDSPHRKQYLAMVSTVAKHVQLEPEPHPAGRHLRVVS